MEEKIFGGIWGLCTADALGVPFEFKSREVLNSSPAVDMRGYGTYNQPKGTWSDDTSMTLCLLDSLSRGLDYQDICRKFLAWLEEGEYTPYGEVFDVGNTSREAILAFKRGVPALLCGKSSEYDNGNGSLMRVLPLVFYLVHHFGYDFFEDDEAVSIIHNVSALTHAHKRSQMACVFYLAIAARLLGGDSLEEGVSTGIEKVWSYYSHKAGYSEELSHFSRIHDPAFSSLPVEEIESTGYVIHSLEAAIWCLLNTQSYEACVLKAVNLGEDTDTTAAIAGGIAGIFYGYSSIPQKWINSIARKEYIDQLCVSFVDSLS